MAVVVVEPLFLFLEPVGMVGHPVLSLEPLEVVVEAVVLQPLVVEAVVQQPLVVEAVVLLEQLLEVAVGAVVQHSLNEE